MKYVIFLSSVLVYTHIHSCITSPYVSRKDMDFLKNIPNSFFGSSAGNREKKIYTLLKHKKFHINPLSLRNKGKESLYKYYLLEYI